MFEMPIDTCTSPANAPYMSPVQLEYFRKKLLKWRSELVESTRDIMLKLNNEADVPPIEEMERSVQSLERELTLQSQSRNWHLIKQIDRALVRIDDGTYGYCEESDEPIGFGRLDANPVAVYCLSIQEYMEQHPNACH